MKDEIETSRPSNTKEVDSNFQILKEKVWLTKSVYTSAEIKGKL